MLVMKDKSFLYELRAYLIYVKAGEYYVLCEDWTREDPVGQLL